MNLRGGSLPRRDAAAHVRPRRGDRGRRNERRLAVRSARARRATEPSRACRASAATARGRRPRVSRVDPPPGLEPGAARLLTADLDNNGAADLIVAGPAATRVLLGGPGGSYTALPDGAAARRAGGGRSRRRRPARARRPRSGRAAGSRRPAGARNPIDGRSFRPRAATATGDQRINSFGIGGEIELRSGLHLQKQVITSPLVHFGLGEAAGAEVVRITWPNGVLQAEFDTQGRPGGHGDAAPQGIVPVALRVERTRDVVRDRPASGGRRWGSASTRRRRPTC